MNYQSMRKKMEKEFEWMKQCCLEENKSDEMIEEIHRMLLDELNSDRKYYNHNQSPDAVHSSKDKKPGKRWSSSYENRLKQSSVYLPEISEWGREDWIQDLDSKKKFLWIKQLSDMDKKILTYINEGKLLKKDIAKVLGCSRSTISKHLKKMGENWEKFSSEH